MLSLRGLWSLGLRWFGLASCAGVASLLLASVVAASPAAPSTTEPAEAVDFQRDVRPILSDNCFQCHGPDSKTRMAELRLDTREGAFGQRKSGTPIVAGDPQSSLLYQRIATKDPARRMPPAFTNKELTTEQIDLLKRWIEEGASWELHWSFRTLERPEPAAVNNEAWVRNVIDRFILARLEAEGLEPAPEADRRTLIRRLSLDLTGLPPTPEQVEAFVHDSAENAYEKLVQRLLDSPHWGEHRGRYWLEAARYADTHGLHIDNYREMWPYRDWVIQAFNRNVAFDRFTIEQLAGDLLPNPTLEQRIATGFHRCNVTTDEGGVILEEVEAIYAKDRVDTTGTVWLGLTVACATCHDHKFDPIATKDFYSLSAFFRNTTQFALDGNVSDPPPIVVVPRLEERSRWEELKRKLAQVASRMQAKVSSADEKFETWLASGEYRAVEAPLGKSSEVLTLSLNGRVAVNLPDRQVHIDLPEGVSLGAGPEEDRKALQFAKEAWAELPNIEQLDAERPFSIAVWVYHPKSDEDFSVVSQFDHKDKWRGWSLSIDRHVPGFKMVGDDGKYIEIKPTHLAQMEGGTWNHVAVSYDGSSERAGLNFYLNGRVVPTRGTEYFSKIKGNIRISQPILLGKQVNEIDTWDLAGGAIADFRVFNRTLTVEQARLVSLWPALERARNKQPSELTEDEREALYLYYLNRKDEEYSQLAARLRELQLERREVRRRGAVTHVMHERSDAKPFAHILYRGAYNQPRDRVEPATPAALPPMPASLPRNRLGLAKWLVDDSNPLTARVAVNRFWQEVFGTGIVKTSDDFGSQGEPPSHPKLLDWLAVEFRESGWNVKGLFRLMVTSATYRQAAATSEEKLAKDAENRLLSRGPRYRMDAEMLRDYALAASGLLVPKIGGPSVKPYQPPGVWKTVAMPDSNTSIYEQDQGDKLYRRSLYTFWKRAAPPASMETFNAPTRENCTVRRERTNTPLQALVTMNDTQFVEAARYLAQKTLQEAREGFDSRLDYMTLRLLARKLQEKERAVARGAYKDFLAYYQQNSGDAEKLLATGESKPAEALPEAESAAWTMLANQIMNLDEVLNK